MKRVTGALITIALAAHAWGARADVWDVQSLSDNSHTTTGNELLHGSDQLHDLAALAGPTADIDYYRISQRSYSSYEVLVEGVSGDLSGRTLELLRVASDGVTVLQAATAVGTGFALSLRFRNTGATAINNQFVLVRGAACGTTCGTDDVYRLRSYETTYAVPRFNNSGTQISVLLLQNPTDYTASGTIYFWGANGAAAGTQPFTLAGKQLSVLNTSIVAPATSGSMTIAHDARYGDLTGKVVALEPATGFSYDTIVTPRPK